MGFCILWSFQTLLWNIMEHPPFFMVNQVNHRRNWALSIQLCQINGRWIEADQLDDCTDPTVGLNKGMGILQVPWISNLELRWMVSRRHSAVWPRLGPESLEASFFTVVHLSIGTCGIKRPRGPRVSGCFRADKWWQTSDGNPGRLWFPRIKFKIIQVCCGSYDKSWSHVQEVRMKWLSRAFLRHLRSSDCLPLRTQDDPHSDSDDFTERTSHCLSALAKTPWSCKLNHETEIYCN